MVKKVVDELDTTALFDFVGQAGELGTKAAAGTAVSGTKLMEGAPAGLEAGIYVWDGQALLKIIPEPAPAD